MNCWLCHGKEGRGNGPSASSLTDSKGYPITPFDFTSGTRFKCGESDQGIFRDLMTGLDGTPMPSFADALKPDQAWDIVHYIDALRTGVARSSQAQAAPQVEPKPEPKAVIKARPSRIVAIDETVGSCRQHKLVALQTRESESYMRTKYILIVTIAAIGLSLVIHVPAGTADAAPDR